MKTKTATKTNTKSIVGVSAIVLVGVVVSALSLMLNIFALIK